MLLRIICFLFESHVLRIKFIKAKLKLFLIDMYKISFYNEKKNCL